MVRLESEIDNYLHSSDRPGYLGACLVSADIPDRLLPELAHLDIMKRTSWWPNCADEYSCNLDCHLIAERYIPVLKKALEEYGFTAEELQIDFKW